MTELEEAARVFPYPCVKECVTELEGATRGSLCEGVEWVTELEGATRVFPYPCVKEWRSGVGDRARRGCYECFHISV